MVEETPTRRRVLAGAAAAAGAIACPALMRQAAAAEKLVFMTPFGITIDFLEMENGVAGGFWAKQGLDASVVGAPGTSVKVQAVAGDFRPSPVRHVLGHGLHARRRHQGRTAYGGCDHQPAPGVRAGEPQGQTHPQRRRPCW